MPHTDRVRFLLPGAALVLTACVALAAVCGPVQQQAEDGTATAEASSAADETATALGDNTAILTPDTTQTVTSEPAVATPPPTVTSTPEPTPTWLATFRFPETRPILPAGPGDAMYQTGIFWIDARWAPVESLVARIGSEVCGTGRAANANTATFSIEIASRDQKPGCGYEGAPVILSVNGLDANGSFPWASGQQQMLNVVRGPAFGLYQGAFQFDEAWVPERVVPMIDGRVCGESLTGVEFQGVPVTSYSVVVDPELLVPGCGREGAMVTIVVTGRAVGSDASGEQRIIDTVPWEVGSLIQRPQVDARRLSPLAVQ